MSELEAKQEENELKDEQNPELDDDETGGNKKERRKIEIKFIQDKSRRHITFSKRKHGIMKKAYELSVLTGTQVLLLVVSETGLVYTFTTPKLQPLVTKSEGKSLIQACLNAPEDEADQQDEQQQQQQVPPPQQQQPPQQQALPPLQQVHLQQQPLPPQQQPVSQHLPPQHLLQDAHMPQQIPNGHYQPPPNMPMGGYMPNQGYPGGYGFDQNTYQ